MSDGDAETQGGEALLDYLRQSRAVDFTGYKRSTLLRRINTTVVEMSLRALSDAEATAFPPPASALGRVRQA